MNMKDAKKPKNSGKNGMLFVIPLHAETGAFDNGKSWPDHQTAGQYLPADYSKELDFYLQLAFGLNSDNTYPDIPELFAETPPMLQKALAERIAHATELLTKILESYEGAADSERIRSGTDDAFVVSGFPAPLSAETGGTILL